MRLGLRSLALRLGLAVAAVAAGTLVAWLVRPLVDPHVLPPLLLAVAVTALFGGFLPGLLATTLGELVLNHSFATQ